MSGSPTHGKEWTTGYSKVCSPHINELDAWAHSKLGRRSISRCRTCQPQGNTSLWPLEPGQAISRKSLHVLISEVYGGGGGQRQGGICTPDGCPEVVLFTDPSTGHQHGYFDTWRDDGAFHYTGMGQHGDQQMIAGNRAILEHKSRGQGLRLFDGSSGEVTYQGQFDIAEDLPWYSDDAPESGSGSLRKVIIFRLLLVHPDVVSPPGKPSSKGAIVRHVSIEKQHTETYVMVQTAQSIYAERVEQQLVLAYEQELKSRGHTIGRHEYRPSSVSKPFYCDLFDESTNRLVEAKGSVTRESIRMAIGQLYDYARFEPAKVDLAVLLPERPRPDLEALLLGLGIAIVYRDRESFYEIVPADG